MTQLNLHVKLQHPKRALDVDASCEHFPLVVLGPSGAGKTTLLECLAGLLTPEAGRIDCNGSTLFDSSTSTRIPPHRRRIGYVMQDGALFPHLNVRDNVFYSLRWHFGSTKQEHRKLQESALSLLDELGIAHLSGSKPQNISGGERTRVALARALVSRPFLLLLDEPFTGLDPLTRQSTQQLLVDVLQNHRIPMILVTHDRSEALSLGRWMWLLLDGKVAQDGVPDEVLRQPVNQAAATFVGMENLLPGEVVGVEGGLCRVRCGPHLLLGEGTWKPGTAVYLCVRPEDLVLSATQDAGSSARNRLAARVSGLREQGPFYRVNLEAGLQLSALLTRDAVQDLQIETGRSVVASFKATAAHLLVRAPRDASDF